MKIVVLGTSNSVMGGNGFIKALELDHEVIQLSSGRVPFFYHIKILENNKALIESADLLLIDHYINDLNFYLDALGQDYEHLSKDFYTLLSSINTRILNVLFPVWNLKERSTYRYYEYVKKLSHSYSLTILDLNNFPFSEEHFKDNIHLSHDASYGFGIVLGKELLLSSLGEKPEGGYCEDMPFKIINLESIPSPNEVKAFKNSLMSINYVDVKTKFMVNMPSSSRLLSLGYLRLKNREGNSGVMINGQKFGLRGTGYFHESVDCDLVGELEISPILQNEHSIQALMGRGKVEGPFSYCYLTELFFYDDSVCFKVKSATHSLFNISLINLMAVIDRLCLKADIAKFPKLQSKTINLLRQMAVRQESKDIEVALDLMTLANLARPSGSLIKTKLHEYKEKIKEKNY